MPARTTLHGHFMSGPTYKVGLALSLMGEPFDYVHVDLRRGDQKAPDYLAKNRFGQVPCLVDAENGRSLCQAASILDYLADKAGKLGGAGPDGRIVIREWMFWEYDRFAAPIYRSRAAKLGFRQLSPEAVAGYATEGGAALGVLDAQLAGRRWLVGETPTIADVDLYGVVRYAPEGGFDLAIYPNVQAWMAGVEALPGFKTPEQALPRESRAA